MSTLRYGCLVGRAWFECLRYDLQRWLGVRDIRRHLGSTSGSAGGTEETAKTVCDAVAMAACWYWKPVLCLQRSIATTRLLRAHGLPARVVIGYRHDPFMSHAWVEVDRLVMPEAEVYRQRLRVLYTI